MMPTMNKWREAEKSIKSKDYSQNKIIWNPI